MAENSAGSGNFYRMGQQSMKTGLSVGASDTGAADAVSGIADVIAQKGREIDMGKKLDEKGKKTARDEAGVKISNAFIEMGPQLKALGQESYTQAQNEVEALREQMYAAIDCNGRPTSDCQKQQADINIKLNAMKERHAGDADNLDTLVSSWEDESVSTAAMTEDQMRDMENFATNKSRRAVYSDEQPPQLMYEWDVPVMDETGEQMIDENGQPVTEPTRRSIQELQDMIHTKETASGVELIDLEQQFKEQAQNPKTAPSYGAMKRQIGKIIPMDQKRMRDWLHGNPAEHHGLDVHGYLVDLMSSDFGTFDKLGIDLKAPEYAKFDLDGDGVEIDEVPQWFKDDLIKNVMDVKDLEISHGIITEIYTRRIHNNVGGKGSLNKNYHPEDNTGLGTPEEKGLDLSVEATAARQEKLQKLQSLDDADVLKGFGGATVKEIANELGLDPNDSILNPETGDTESIATYIANAKNKTAGASGVGGKYNKPE